MIEIDDGGIIRQRFHSSPRVPASTDADGGLTFATRYLNIDSRSHDCPRVGPYKTLKNYKEGDWNAIEVIVTGAKARCTCDGEILEDALQIPDKGRLPSNLRMMSLNIGMFGSRRRIRRRGES